jgi:hypothetical protein
MTKGESNLPSFVSHQSHIPLIKLSREITVRSNGAWIASPHQLIPADSFSFRSAGTWPALDPVFSLFLTSNAERLTRLHPLPDKNSRGLRVSSLQAASARHQHSA